MSSVVPARGSAGGGKRSRGAQALLAAANRILTALGFSSQIKHQRHPIKKIYAGRPLSPLRSPPALAAPPMSPGVPDAAAPSKMNAAIAEYAQLNAPLPNNPKRSAKDFIFGKVIGEGCFSTVYLARYTHTGQEYAIKVCDKSHIIREKKSEYIKREKEILKMLFDCERGFVKLYCTFQDSERLYFVLSYAKNGELNPHINRVGSFDVECTRFYAAELVLALEQLQQKGIIHRDLKPENILLDENMHILVTDFGSAKIVKPAPEVDSRTAAPGDADENDNSEDGLRQRRMSFVGTAQYVSPELLTDKSVSRASDLWALGCIIYQMISGLPPFRSNSEYLIFQKIIKLNYKFPEGFDENARDLVEKLLVLDPTKRLGAMDVGPTYDSIRRHPFFEGVDWERVRETRPPPIHPNLAPSLKSEYRVPEHLEPGLGNEQLSRILDMHDAVPVPPKSVPNNSLLNFTPDEYRRELDKQRETNKWHRFVDGNLILKQGLVDKRKGLFARRRMLLLTTGPRLFYVDPTNMVVKGEIPWSDKLWVEPKNFKIFFVHTPNRTYYLEDPESFALDWCKTIEDVHRATYPQTT